MKNMGDYHNHYFFKKMYCLWLMFKGLRGGISYIAKRHTKANNKYMNDCDSKKTVKIYIIP